MEVNGNHFKNKAGNWQRIVFGTKAPAWSEVGKKTEPKFIKDKPVECAYCKKIKPGLAFHPTNKKVKFCSFIHGKLYMIKHPDTRYANK